MNDEQAGSNRYPVTVIARLLNLTERRVQQLANEGVVPKPDMRGEYDLVGCVQGYIVYLQERADRTEDTDQKRLTRAKADREELELAKLRRALIPAEEIEPALEQYVTDVLNQLQGIPERYAGMLQAVEDVEGKRQLLEDLVREVRDELGSYAFATKRIHGTDAAAGDAEVSAAA